MKTEVLAHYRRKDVVKEICKFAKYRWVGVHCEKKGKQGKPILVRYINRSPLTIAKEEDLSILIGRLSFIIPRTFYASISQYRNMKSKEDVSDLSNVISCMPTWDIDVEGGSWRDALTVVENILSKLSDAGIDRSVIIKWSGNGFHVHISSKAFSDSVTSKIHPLDLAYSVTEFVIKKIDDLPNGVKIENRIDPQRLFTCPLSLHRELYRVAVCVDPNDLDGFDISWSEMSDFKHFSGWDKYDEGEGDDLAERAYLRIGGYPLRIRKKAHLPLDYQITKTIKRLERAMDRS